VGGLGAMPAIAAKGVSADGAASGVLWSGFTGLASQPGAGAAGEGVAGSRLRAQATAAARRAGQHPGSAGAGGLIGVRR